MNAVPTRDFVFPAQLWTSRVEGMAMEKSFYWQTAGRLALCGLPAKRLFHRHRVKVYIIDSIVLFPLYFEKPMLAHQASGNIAICTPL
jgi:hypothetical protein